MTIEELIEAKKKLEAEISLSVDAKVQRFQVETGISVTGVSIEVIDASTRDARRFAVASTRVGLLLEL